MPEVRDDLASIIDEGAASARSQFAPQPPQYTIFSIAACVKQAFDVGRRMIGGL
jgi:uncharacterized OsmC-like protein